MKKKILLALAALLLLSFGLTACGGGSSSTSPGASSSATGPASSATADTSWEDVKGKGKLVVGLDDSFPPMGFRENGQLVGYDIDLATEVRKRLDIEVVLQTIDWSAKELELNSKNIDVIWNGFTITPERKANLLVTEPYMTNAQIIVVMQDASYQKLSDLDGKKVAVQNGSSAQEAIAENKEFSDSITQFDFKENVTALLDLSMGQVDAVAVDLVVANYYLSKDPGKYRILDEQLAPEEYGIGFRKGDQALHDKVWGAIEEMKKDGKFDEITEKWFGKKSN